MGKQVSFRQRARGCSVEGLGGGASITEPRVKFVKGWLTGGVDPADGSVECGDGTAYPMLVTRQQLEAIYYRVREAQVTSGSYSSVVPYDNGVDPTGTATLTWFMTAAAPGINLCEYAAGEWYTIRGYCSFTEGISPIIPMGNYGSIFSAAYYVPTFYIDGGTVANLAVRDALSETTLWADGVIYDETLGGSDYPPFSGKEGDSNGFFDAGFTLDGPSQPGSLNVNYVLPYFNLGYALSGVGSLGGGAFRTGFSLSSETNYSVSTTGYATNSTLNIDVSNGEDSSGQSSVNCAFNGRVAYVDNANNGDPFDPSNQIFLGLEFTAMVFYYPLVAVVGTNNNLPYVGSYDSFTTLEFNFGDSGIPAATCKLYLFNDIGELTVLEPFVYTATKWWPYANSDGTPVWDSTTGKKINNTP